MLKNKKGFSLLELLVTVGILAILGTIIFPSFLHSRDNAKENDVRTAANQLVTTVVSCAEERGIYYQLQNIAKMSDNNRFIVVYEQNDDHELVFKEIQTEKNKATDLTNAEIQALGQELADKVNGIVEPVKVDCGSLRNSRFDITLTFGTTMDYIVTGSGVWVE